MNLFEYIYYKIFNMLKQLFQKACCCHDWEERYKTKLFETDSFSRPCEINVTLVCKKYGKN